MLPDTLEELLSVAALKLGIKEGVEYIFKEDGHKIVDISAVHPKDVLFVSTDKYFLRPKANEEQFGEDDWVTLNIGGRVV